VIIVRLPRKDINDIIIYLQKTYCLYFVEFRQTQSGKKVLILCNPNNKEWWIEIFINLFSIEILVECTGKIDRDSIIRDLEDKKYLGSGEKYEGKWLRL
jgi:hypothetical protein